MHMEYRTVSLRPDSKEFIVEDWGWILLFILSMLFVPFASFTGMDYLAMCTGILALALGMVLFIRFNTLLAVVWVVSTDRICRIRGWVTSNTDYVELYRVVDYQESQNILQKLLKIKNVTIVSTDKSEPLLEMYGIDCGYGLVDLIRERVEKCKKENRIYEITNQ